jgi:hypothetical protein
MLINLLNYSYCPISRQNLKMNILESKQKQYARSLIIEMHIAISHSPIGFVFSVINGIPNMQIESIICFESFRITKLAVAKLNFK